MASTSSSADVPSPAREERAAVDAHGAWSDAQQRSVRDQLACMLESSGWRHAPRQQRLLRHIVEATLAGDASRLKGYTLGVEVFDRGADFDPNIDPTVRVEAGRLRAKLIAYYASEGASDAVVIDIPKGGYAARFVFREAPPHGPALSLVDGSPRSRRPLPPEEAVGGFGRAGDADGPDRAPGARRRGARLPLAAERIFGRERDMAALLELLAEHRVVTVIGTGGVGKTRLAQAAARVCVDADRSLRAGWVDLTRIADPALLPAALAQALDLPLAPNRDPLPALLMAMQSLPALVVFDNAEHLIDAVAHLVHAVRDAAPDVRVLVTSQAPLRIEGERLFRLDALALPATDASPDDALLAPAVALFVDRARALGHDVDTRAGSIAAIARICRRLDGLPLAIRLAAAHAPLLGLSALEAQLDTRMLVLHDAGRDIPPHQRTLHEALAWSFSLLAPDEQALLRQLGVFVGGFTLDLAVAAREGGDEEWAVIDRLHTLVERSMVILEPGDPPRYRLLESQREFALRQLEAREGELAAARGRHARAMAHVLPASVRSVWSMPEADWLPLWAPELDNARAALDWSRSHDAALFVALVGWSASLFRVLDLGYELCERAAAVDAAAVAAAKPDDQLAYWLARAVAQQGLGMRPAHDFALQAERVARSIGNVIGLYFALCQRATTGLVPAAQSPVILDEIAALESPAWPPRLRACRRLAEFMVHTVESRWQPALATAQAGFALACEAGARGYEAVFANDIVLALLNLGDVAAAHRRSLELRPHVLDAPSFIAIPFAATSAHCTLLMGDTDGARQALEQMFELSRGIGWTYLDYPGDLYVRLALAEGRCDDAARLLGRADATVQGAWGRTTSSLLPSRETSREQLEAALGPGRLAELIREGSTLGPEAVCALTLGVPLRQTLMQQTRNPPARPL